MNYGGRVIQNTDVFPDLPDTVTEPIRIASSRAFVSGMEQAFITSSTATVVAWMLFRDDSVLVENAERQEANPGGFYAPETSAAD